MGDTVSSVQCLSHLGVPAQRHKELREDVMNFFLECQTGRPVNLSAVDKAEVNRWALKYIQSPAFEKHQRSPVPGGHPQPSNAELHPWLSKLVDIWVIEKDRQESQEDPSYSADVPVPSDKGKKRKRSSDVTTPSKKIGGKPVKKISAAQGAHKDSSKHIPISVPKLAQPNLDSSTGAVRSPTIQPSSSNSQDISFRLHATDGCAADDNSDDDDDELQSHTEILREKRRRDVFSMSDSPEPAAATIATASASRLKGKPVLRNPPVLAPLTTDLRDTSTQASKSFTTTPAVHIDNHVNPVTIEQAEVEVHEPVIKVTGPRRLKTSRMREIEDTENVQSQDSNHNEQLKFLGSPTLSQAQAGQVAEPMTPPPTACPPRFTNPDAQVTAHTNMAVRPPLMEISLPQVQDQRCMNLVHNIVEYIRQCELHSRAMAEAPGNSLREVDKHRIRAKTFGTLHGDIASRVDSFLSADQGAVGMGPVRSYCLWP